jgi:hypothetical protein
VCPAQTKTHGGGRCWKWAAAVWQAMHVVLIDRPRCALPVAMAFARCCAGRMPTQYGQARAHAMLTLGLHGSHIVDPLQIVTYVWCGQLWDCQVCRRPACVLHNLGTAAATTTSAAHLSLHGALAVHARMFRKLWMSA